MEKNTAKTPTRKPLLKKTKKQPVFQDKAMELKARIQKLGQLCNELNPYGAISDDHKKILMSYDILDFSDPFKITNQLLVLLEDSIDELHLLEPLSEEEKKQEIF